MELPSVTKSSVRSLDDEALLEGWEEAYERCVIAAPEAVGALRQQLDLLTQEGTRRKLICWAL